MKLTRLRKIELARLILNQTSYRATVDITIDPNKQTEKRIYAIAATLHIIFGSTEINEIQKQIRLFREKELSTDIINYE